VPALKYITKKQKRIGNCIETEIGSNGTLKVKNSEPVFEDIPEDEFIAKSPMRTLTLQTPGGKMLSSSTKNVTNSMISNATNGTIKEKKDRHIETEKERQKYVYNQRMKIDGEITKTNKDFNSCFPKGSLVKSGFLACFEDENGLTKRTI